jgi:lysophospholipase L1-like esterase
MTDPAPPTRRAALAAAVLAASGVAARAQTAAPASPRPSKELERLRTDWAGLGVYQSDNARLASLAAESRRVVFMGDSITQFWLAKDPGFFAGKPYVDRGISGQTTPQMLVRFRPDVIDLKPRVVHIMAGTNDIAGNLASMCELVRAHDIAVVLGAVPPARAFWWHAGEAPAGRIIALNGWIRSYARSHGFVYADYHTPLADLDGGMKAAFSGDGVHPNPAGYALMDPIATAAIVQASARRR